MSDQSKGPDKPDGITPMWGAGIAIGLGFGVAVGVAIGNVGVGIAIGMGIGVTFAIIFGEAAKRRREAEESPDEPSGDQPPKGVG